MPGATKERRAEIQRKHYYKDLEHSRKQAREYMRRPEQTARQMAWNAKNRKELRQAVYAKYGNICARCPENDPVVFQIDHVNGGGYREMKDIYGNSNNPKFLRRVLEDTEGNFQLLCANCNIKKYRKKT